MNKQRQISKKQRQPSDQKVVAPYHLGSGRGVRGFERHHGRSSQASSPEPRQQLTSTNKGWAEHTQVLAYSEQGGLTQVLAYSGQEALPQASLRNQEPPGHSHRRAEPKGKEPKGTGACQAAETRRRLRKPEEDGEAWPTFGGASENSSEGEHVGRPGPVGFSALRSRCARG